MFPYSFVEFLKNSVLFLSTIILRNIEVIVFRGSKYVFGRF